MGVSLDFFPIAVHKSSRVIQALADKCLELILHDQDKAICVLLPLVLLSTEVNLAVEERHGKKNLVSFPSSSGSKVVFRLLTEVVAFYIELSIVYVQRTSF